MFEVWCLMFFRCCTSPTSKRLLPRPHGGHVLSLPTLTVPCHRRGVRQRLDQVLVERGLCESREKAKRAVMAGAVRVNGQVAAKPSDSVGSTDGVELTAGEKFVSRGGHKLEHALEHFQIEVTGATAIDLGASTGGFTDCLLQRGAAKVFAVDVGQGQLAYTARFRRRS